MSEPLSPRFKTFLYNCYTRESQNNPTVSLQAVYTMAIDKYKRPKSPLQSRQISQSKAENTNALITPIKKTEKMCNISLELIANHKKHRKKLIN